MQAQVRVALLIVAVLYLVWGFALLLAPETAHKMLSSAPYSVTTTAMFGACLFAFATMFLIAAHEPSREIVHASAVALLFLGATAAYQMAAGGSMPKSTSTVVSLIINLGAAIFLFISLTEAAMQIVSGRGSKRAKRRPTRRRR